MPRKVTRTVTSSRDQNPVSTWDLIGTAAAAVERMWAQDIDLPERPAGQVPTLPEDLTETSDSALMSLFRELTEWQGYMGSRLAVAEVDEQSYESELRTREAQSAALNTSAKNVTQAKAAVFTDPDYIAAREAKEHAYAYRKIMASVHDATEKKTTLVSRELTRRVGRDPREGRNARWNA